MIDTSALMFPKPNVGKDRRRKQRGKEKEAALFRKQVLVLDNNKCLDLKCECHRETNPILDPHHIDLKARGVDNRVENGATLCRYGAHRRVHDGYYKDGTFVTPDQVMLEILEQHLGSIHWRWDEQYDRLKRKVAA